MAQRICLVLSILLLSFTVAWAQPTGTTKSKAADKAFTEALRDYQLGAFDRALENLDKALKKDDEFLNAMMLAGEIHEITRNYEKAIEYYNKALETAPDFAPPYFQFGMLLYDAGAYKQSANLLRQFVKFPDISTVKKSTALSAIDNCYFAIKAVANPVPFNPKSLGPNINSYRDEYAPAVTSDGKYLIFTRLLINSRDTSLNMSTINNPNIQMQEDFYVSEKIDGKWQKARNIGPPVNTRENEGQPNVSADGQYIFFAICKGVGKNSDCNIYYTFLAGNQWERPRNIGSPVNTKHWESQPSISSDGKTLYFSSNRPGGMGGIDIWASTLQNGKWGEPKNLGPNINTAGDEQSPNIYYNNRTLTFNSTGHIGMGGSDLYIANLNDEDQWEKPRNLGYPINTPNDELTLSISSDGRYAYYVTNRLSASGSMDIYSFELPEDLRPEQVSYVTGTVFDAETKRKLQASVELIDLETGEQVLRFFSNGKTGKYLICLPSNRNYALNVSRDGYLFFSENFSLKESPSSDPFVKDAPLKPIKPGEFVVLKNVFFDTDKFTLKPESQVELNKLAEFLKKNEKLRIELGGHTDNQGSKQHNQTLSQNRAKAVKDFLVNLGIAANRMTSKGYGDSKPIADNATEAGRKQNRRTEFKILPN